MAWANDSIASNEAIQAVESVEAEPATTTPPALPPVKTPLPVETPLPVKTPLAIEIKDTKPEPRARSLDALVQRHAGTKTPDREAECLAGAVYFESKGEPADGQLAVAHVILNRAKSGRFPASACGVVFQPSQFSFVRGRGFPPIARSSQQWKTAVAVSHIALNNLWMSTVSDALFFHARRVAPGWRLKRIAAVGNHVFYR
jgi:spore germination cell wall hydrolase CwlJ-like protein